MTQQRSIKLSTLGLGFGALALLIAIVLAAATYAYMRRNALQYLRGSIAQPVPHRLRLVACLFLFLAAVLSALAARAAPWAGLVALLLVAALPWQRWAGLPGAP